MSNYHNEAVIALAYHLLPEDPSLGEEVWMAVQEPSAYIQAFERRLEPRSIVTPIEGLPWIALVDGLAYRGRLFEVDWKAAPEDVISSLKALLRRSMHDGVALSWVDAMYKPDAMPHEALPLIGKEVRRYHLSLIALDMGNDSYPLMLVATARLLHAQHLAERSGYDTIDNYSTDTNEENG